MAAGDLRPLWPTEIVDRAIATIRAHFRVHAEAATLGSLPLALGAIVLAYLAGVVRVRGLVLPFALLFPALCAWRAIVGGALSSVTRDAALSKDLFVAPSLGALLTATRGKRVELARTGMVAAFNATLWGGAVAGFYSIHPVVGWISIGLLTLRGTIAPSWAVHVALDESGPHGALGRALADRRENRFEGFVVELLLVGGWFLLVAAGYTMLLLAASVARGLLGLDVALIDAFLSPSNGFVFDCVMAAAWLLTEPVRASANAWLWLDARVRREALDLRARVEAVAKAGRAAGAGWAAVLALVLVAPAAASAHPIDAPAREGAREILAESEFHRGRAFERRTFGDWIEERIENWFRSTRPDEPRVRRARASGCARGLPVPGSALWIGAAVALIAVLFVTWLRNKGPLDDARAPEDPAAAVPPDPRDRPPEAHLGDAAALAAQGRYREALRAVFLACLVALDRKGTIRFDPNRTNGQHVRALGPGPVRERLAGLVRLFDWHWYGEQSPTVEDYRLAVSLASELIAERAHVAAA